MVLEYGYCEYRPNEPCRYMWEALIRSDLEVVENECYAPENERCDLSLAMTHRTFYLKEITQNNETVCDKDMKAALESVFEYCDDAVVCLGSKGEQASFRDDVEQKWKSWLNSTHYCNFLE